MIWGPRKIKDFVGPFPPGGLRRSPRAFWPAPRVQRPTEAARVSGGRSLSNDLGSPQNQGFCGAFSARKRKVTICPRVHWALGANLPFPTPPVTPLSEAQVTAAPQ